MTKGGASLYATPPCACYDGEKGSKEKIKDIVITSNKNYTDTYQAGSNLSPLMSIEGMYYPYNPNQQDTLLYSKQKVNEYISKKTIIPILFSLLFDSPPTQDKKHIFTIRYELDNGEVYTYTTPEITFQ